MAVSVDGVVDGWSGKGIGRWLEAAVVVVVVGSERKTAKSRGVVRAASQQLDRVEADVSEVSFGDSESVRDPSSGVWGLCMTRKT